MKKVDSILFLIAIIFSYSFQAQVKVNEIPLGMGWAKNSINVVKFRKNALTTFKGHQYAAYYDPSKIVVVAKRALEATQWDIKNTSLLGDTNDAHNSISIALDGKGYLHLAWNHHNDPLHYQISNSPEQLEFQTANMIGLQENSVTYPEFHNLPNGNLLFLYRDGSSGNGNLVVNLYNVQNQQWERLHDSLIDGEGMRNAYWQSTVDQNGIIHLSWVWRESPDVASNHDINYAKSYDSGVTWVRADDSPYSLPITAKNAEIAWHVAQNKSLMNQTDMTTDQKGNPFIANYWEESDGVQYRVVYHDGMKWIKRDLKVRQGTFRLSGGGTKKIPISRPSVLIEKDKLLLIYRDEQKGNKVQLSTANLFDNKPPKTFEITYETVNDWEPNYDTVLWQRDRKLNLFVQSVEQVDGEGLANFTESLVRVLSIENW